MSHVHKLDIEGHKIVALTLNPLAKGQPFILMHGVAHSIYFWQLDNVFQDYGKCYSLSLPGHFPASFPSNFRRSEFNADMIARILTKAIRQLVGDQQVTLVGISTGGFSALNIARYAPEFVKRVVCISGFAHGEWIGVLGIYQSLARLGILGETLFRLGYAHTANSRTMFTAGARTAFANSDIFDNHPQRETIIALLYPFFQKLDKKAMLHYFATMPDINIRQSLSKICVPTLVMAGDKDPVVPPTQAHIIAESVPHAELAMIPDAGHLLFAEKPQAYEHVLKEWLENTTLA
ncbi:MAG: hypothetical protein B6242_06770 [Anaerolineaceae bacterium 4572_78]|nr:MAG: hypothetical protein B6242_06770 [Anaerolineaceae bacterium 4572_78]